MYVHSLYHNNKDEDVEGAATPEQEEVAPSSTNKGATASSLVVGFAAAAVFVLSAVIVKNLHYPSQEERRSESLPLRSRAPTSSRRTTVW